MHKELVKVNENWNVLTCVKEMRIQAENISRVHSIYVVDDEETQRAFVAQRFIDNFFQNANNDVYIRKLNSVKVDTEDVEVAHHAKIRFRSHSGGG
jgi:magnesium transporter